MQLKLTDLVVGTGPAAEPKMVLSVRYRGFLRDNTPFDASGPDPFRFPLGEGVVILGWDQGLVGMRVGGRRRLEIPPELGYGAEGSPPEIPPNAELIFEIELVAVSRERW